MSEDSNGSGRIIGVIILVVVLLGGLAGGWYWFMYKPEQEAIERARLEQIAKEEEEQKRKELAAQKKAAYEPLIVRADSAFQEESWEDARSLYSEASALLPNEAYPKEQLAQVNARLDEIAESQKRIAAGVIETITSRTGRFYVIVSSSIDDDLAMDYAKKLAAEGNDVKIIAHDTSRFLYFRVALNDYATEEEGRAALSSYSSYGEGVWVLQF